MISAFFLVCAMWESSRQPAHQIVSGEDKPRCAPRPLRLCPCPKRRTGSLDAFIFLVGLHCPETRRNRPQLTQLLDSGVVPCELYQSDACFSLHPRVRFVPLHRLHHRLGARIP
jgi:hypothetical protein